MGLWGQVCAQTVPLRRVAATSTLFTDVPALPCMGFALRLYGPLGAFKPLKLYIILAQPGDAMPAKKKPDYRVLIGREGKDTKLLEVGALWAGKNDSFSGPIELLNGAEMRIVIVPIRADEQLDI